MSNALFLVIAGCASVPESPQPGHPASAVGETRPLPELSRLDESKGRVEEEKKKKNEPEAPHEHHHGGHTP